MDPTPILKLDQVGWRPCLYRSNKLKILRYKLFQLFKVPVKVDDLLWSWFSPHFAVIFFIIWRRRSKLPDSIFLLITLFIHLSQYFIVLTLFRINHVGYGDKSESEANQDHLVIASAISFTNLRILYHTVVIIAPRGLKLLLRLVCSWQCFTIISHYNLFLIIYI